jgi:hypothetical protein
MQANNNEIVDRVRMKQNVANYKKQMRQFILTSRFNNTTFNENREYRQRNKKKKKERNQKKIKNLSK